MILEDPWKCTCLFTDGIYFLFNKYRVSPFLAWVDFHARSRFARSTIPEEKWGTTRSLHLNPYLVNWYLSFLMDRKQRLIFKGLIYKWHNVSKGTTRGSVSGPHLFHLFIDDLAIS